MSFPEGTALSLAKLTLDTVLPLAKHAIADEAMLLLGVRQEVSFITNELEMMQAFLRAANAGDRACNEVVKVWVKQVHDLACDVEDCLQEYLALDLGVRCDLLPSAGLLRDCLVSTSQLPARHRIVVRIREVKASVEEVSKRNLRYNIVVQPGPAGPTAYKHLIIPLTFAADVDANESLLVGRDQQRADLLARLTTSPSKEPLQVLAVCGMGGVGKTVLVRNVLRSSELGRVFECRAWVTVPHPFSMVEFLRSFVSQLDVEAGSASAKRTQTAHAACPEATYLARDVMHHLEDKRYTVVVDDVSSVAGEWDQIKMVLPDRKMGSWIIVTTRYEEVAMHCSTTLPSHLYPLSHLSPKDALQLLCKKAHINSPLSKELIDEADPILQRCCGLPLAVAAVGGLLATKPKTAAEWRKLHDHFSSELTGNPGLVEIKDVLNSSYDGLPYHLKSCFLYLSIFPKYREIRQSRLLRRWMAEGLATESRDMAPEYVAESCFNQLISRSMIQPATKWVNLHDRIDLCQVHDLMREIILAKSIEENQLFVLNDQYSSTLPPEKVRHLVVTAANHGRENILESINLLHVRSLTIAGECPQRLIIASKMRMLRVLDLEDCPDVEDTDLSNIRKLQHLKYLGLRRTRITKLPSSLGKLKFLETLDIRYTKVTVVPQGFTKLQKLRHIRAGTSMRYKDNNLSIHQSTTSVRVPEGIEKLRSLRVLGNINVGQHGGQRILKDIRKLVVLRFLEVTGLAAKDGPEFRDTIHALRNLRGLQVHSKHSGSLRFLDLVSSPPPHLLTLRLYGYLGGQLSGWIGSVRDITKIKLLATELLQDAIDVLGDLPNLVALHLWRKSYTGEELRMRASKFRKLKLIDVDRLDDLASVVIEEEAMKQLERLWLDRCCNLSDDQRGVVGVLFLGSLKEIRLKYSGGKNRLEAILRTQVDEHHNRPQFDVIVASSSGGRDGFSTWCNTPALLQPPGADDGIL